MPVFVHLTSERNLVSIRHSGIGLRKLQQTGHATHGITNLDGFSRVSRLLSLGVRRRNRRSWMVAADQVRAMFSGHSFGAPCTEADIRRAAAALGEPLPPALRELYLAF